MHASVSPNPRRNQTRLLFIDKRIILSVAAILITVFMIEFGARAFLFAKTKYLDPNLPVCRDAYATQLTLSCHMPTWSQEFNEAVAWDPYLGFRNSANLKGERLNTNSLGYRGEEVTQPKPSDMTRIVVLGGSTAMGYGVYDDETIPAYLEKILKDELPDQQIEVINAAMAGFNSSQELVQLSLDVLDLEPDMVIIIDGANDLLFGLATDWQPHRTPAMRQQAMEYTAIRKGEAKEITRQVFRAILHQSTALALVQQFRLPRANKENFSNFTLHPETIDVYMMNHLRMASLAKDSGIKIVFVLQPLLGVGDKALSDTESTILKEAPDFSLKMNQHLSEITVALADSQKCTMNHTLCLDFVNVFATHSQTLFIDGVHFNPLGNQIFAQQLAKKLLATDWAFNKGHP